MPGLAVEKPDYFAICHDSPLAMPLSQTMPSGVSLAWS
jgi:hypothetical protein